MGISFFSVLITLVCIAVHLWRMREPRTMHRVVGVVLLYLLVVMVGVTGVFAAYGHTAMAAKVAEEIGWPPGNPFQFEVAMANLALGVLGIMCIWKRGDFWLATII